MNGQAWVSHARDWSHIASYPSGHPMATTALATVVGAAIPRLRAALVVYVGAVGLTRVLFGAHFPLDVIVGSGRGYYLGLLAFELVSDAGWLPRRRSLEPRCDRRPAAG